MTKRLIVLCFVLGLAAWPHTSFAQEESLNAARAAFDEGQALFVEKKYAEAALQFQIAYNARPFPQFLLNSGTCYVKAKDYPKALTFYKKYLEVAPNAEHANETKKRIATIEKAIRDAQASPNTAFDSEEVKALEGGVELRGLVVIESEPQGATIYLDSRDNKPLSKTPWNGTLTGEHVLIMERRGYKTIEKTIRPAPDKLLVFFWGLAEEDYLGWIDITSNVPGANIYIDDKSVGAKAKTPWSGNLEPGKHTIWVTREGYDEFTTVVEIIAGEPHKVSATLEGTEPGLINVRGRGVENVTVYVDGKVLCERGPCIRPLAPGTHQVSIRREGYKSYNQTIEVQSKTEVTVQATLAEEPSRLDAVVAYVFSAAFVGAGYWAGTKADDLENQLRDEINGGSPPVDDHDPRFLRGKLYAIGATTGYVLGGATFAAALYYTFRDKGQPSTGSSDIQEIKSVSFEPTITPNYAGFSLSTSF